MLSELINTGPTLLALTAIVNDGGTQMRAGMNADKVKEYEELLLDADGWPFDAPVVVYYDGAKYWLADGFHRLNAAHRSGKFRKYQRKSRRVQGATRCYMPVAPTANMAYRARTMTSGAPSGRC